jgi:hypothetical protein
MSIVELVPAWLHGIGDYGAGVALLVVALIVGGTDKAVLTGVVLLILAPFVLDYSDSDPGLTVFYVVVGVVA